jgi:hypothetical protein
MTLIRRPRTLDGRRLRPVLLLGFWVLITYGFRLVTAIRMRTWDSVTASIVLLGLSVAVAVLAWRSRSGRPQPALTPLVRVLDVLAIAWSLFRLTTVWVGHWSAVFRAVHTVIEGVLLILAIWSLLVLRDRRVGGQAVEAQAVDDQGAAAPMPAPVPGEDPVAADPADGSAQTVPLTGVTPVRK